MTDKIILKLEEGVKLRAVNQKPAESIRIRTSNGMSIRSVAQNPIGEVQGTATPRATAQAPQTSGQSASTSNNSQKN